MIKTLALFHQDSDYIATLLPQFQCALPDHRVVVWTPGQGADYLVSWKPEPQIFATDGVQVLFALGAGVDAYLAAPLPEELPLVRLQEAGMGSQMLEIALYAVLHYSRDMIALNRAQRDKQWLGIATPKKLPFSARIGVMGLGELGGFVAEHLAAVGYPVSGYSRRLKSLKNVSCYDDGDFDTFLANSEVLINLLPLTPQTEDVLNTDLFAKLPKGAYVVNIARGRHLVEGDLITALDSGQISGAFLDVFRTEPLPDAHPFWQDDRITITPHLAAITVQSDAVAQIRANILAFEAGESMTGVVDRQRGY